MAVQWLGLRALTVKDLGSIPVQGTKILHAARCSQKKKKKKLSLGNVSGCCLFQLLWLCNKPFHQVVYFSGLKSEID